jgi:ribosomal protein S12 methylthiotransferase
MPGRTFFIETLGCPKNEVDSDKLAGTLLAEGYAPATEVASADLLVVNTCAFIEAAREESVATILELAGLRRRGSRLVVTGCMAERYRDELATELPEVDLVAPFGVPLHEPPPVRLASPGRRAPAGDPPLPSFDLLNLPRPPASAPWAYVKVAEGCDRTCGFCAIPSFRGRQRSRAAEEILAEVDALGAVEVVLVAQDLASYGRDLGRRGALAPLVRKVAEMVPRVRLLYLDPSAISVELVETIAATGVPYFDLSLQHASGPLLRTMRRYGDAGRFHSLLRRIRDVAPDAALRSSFIVGHPGETEADHDALLRFLAEAELDWAGFFAFSAEDGTRSAQLPGAVEAGLVAERLLECGELQDSLTARRRVSLVGSRITVLVDEPGAGRSHREAPEIDGIVRLPRRLPVGSFAEVVVTAAAGPDLEAA